MPGGETLAPTRLQREGLFIDTGAPVTAAVSRGDGVFCAHGDGRVQRFSDRQPAPRVFQPHDGVVLAMAAAGEQAVVTGGDDGRFVRLADGGDPEVLAVFDGQWVDCVAAHVSTGRLACSAGKTVYLWSPGAAQPRTLEHPSTVGGIAFDPKGRRLAVAHYGGATIWERNQRRWAPTRLAWAGSHVGITWSPGGRFVVSVMQENALHGWRLRDRMDMRMSGYPGKPKSLDWAGEQPWLVTSGAEGAVCWPFGAEDGPMGQVPLCIAQGGAQMASVVLGLPGQEAVMAGYPDGAVLMSKLREDADDRVVRGTTGAEVTALAATSSLSHLLIGDADGGVLWAPLLKSSKSEE